MLGSASIGYQKSAQKSIRKSKLRKGVLFKVKGHTGVRKELCSETIEQSLVIVIRI